MSDFDDAMGGLGEPAEPSLEEQARAMIPALRVFRVVRTAWVEEKGVSKETTTTTDVMAHSTNTDRRGNALFFELRFMPPNQIHSFITRIINSRTLVEVEDMGPVPESRIIH